VKAKWILTALLVGLCLGIALACTNGGKEKEVEEAPKESDVEAVEAPQEPKKEALEIESADWVRGDYGTRYISGIVRNNSDHSYGYVQITVPLYDADGNQVGSALDNINDLNPGGTWKFKAIVLEEGKLTFRQSEIEVSGW